MLTARVHVRVHVALPSREPPASAHWQGGTQTLTKRLLLPRREVPKTLTKRPKHLPNTYQFKVLRPTLIGPKFTPSLRKKLA